MKSMNGGDGDKWTEGRYQQVDDGLSLVISSDLRHAIDMLSSVPSGRVVRRCPQKRCDNSSRPPLRAVSSSRFSLPPQLSACSNSASEDLALRQCSSLTDDVDRTSSGMTTGSASPAATVDSPGSVGDGRSDSAWRYMLPWKIRRVKKHKLQQVLVDKPSSKSKHRHQETPSWKPATTGAGSGSHTEPRRLDFSCDSEDDDIDEKQSASSESLDSVVERILENAAKDSAQRRSSKRRRRSEEVMHNGVHFDNKAHNDSTYPVHASDEHSQRTTQDEARCKSTASSNTKEHHGYVTSAHSVRDQRRAEKTLEDLFEEAVESLRDDSDYFAEPVLTPQHRRLRSAENWERQVHDSELHDQCRHYRLQTYTTRDFCNVSRGFAVVQKREMKPTPDLESNRKDVLLRTSSNSPSQCRDGSRDISYLQRTVISAKSASNETRQSAEMSVIDDDGVDLALDAELAANQRQRASRSSSVTWDSVSVDSLVMYDDEEASVHAAALYSSTAAAAAAAAERRQLNDEFVEKLRRLQDEWQRSVADHDENGKENENDEAVWVPMSQHDEQHNHEGFITSDIVAQDTSTFVDAAPHESHIPETDGAVTSAEKADSAVILSDMVTTQEVVINIKLPRRCRPQSASSPKHQVPTIPFRELRLRREIRFVDDADLVKPSVTSSCDTDNVTNGSKSQLKEIDDVTTADGTVVTAECLLGDVEQSVLLADAEVEYENKDSSRSVELVPVSLIDAGSSHQVTHRVDITRSDATRVLRLPLTPSSRLLYQTPSLLQAVDNVRLSMLANTTTARTDGVTVSCEAVETVSRHGDKSSPVVHNIVVDCFPPNHTYHHNDSDVETSENTS